MRKGKIALISGGAVGAVLLVVATILLIRGIHGFRQSVAELGREKQKLAKFYRLDPFPSDVNVRLERGNVDLLGQKFDLFITRLRAGNVSSEKVTGPGFSRTVGVLKTQLAKQAREARPAIALPTGFAFGFEHYAGTGVLPKPAQAQRLSTQLLMVNRLSKLLFQSEIDALLEVKRDTFENPGGASAGAGTSVAPSMLPGLPTRPPRGQARRETPSRRSTPAQRAKRIEKLYEKERFELTFRAKETSLLKVLNALSSSPMFCVVEQVKLAKRLEALEAADPTAATVPVGLPGASPAGGVLNGLLGGVPGAVPAASPDAPEKLEAVQVCGVEIEVPMTVTLVLDVYNFVGGEAGGEDE